LTINPDNNRAKFAAAESAFTGKLIGLRDPELWKNYSSNINRNPYHAIPIIANVSGF